MNKKAILPGCKRFPEILEGHLYRDKCKDCLKIIVKKFMKLRYFDEEMLGYIIKRFSES